MATGAPGTNGVWQYGEDESEATFSALLNKTASTADTQIGLDRARLTTLEAKPTAGMVPISAGSVTAVSGSASVNSLGVITFTNCSSIQLNSVFTSAYKNYKIILNVSGTSIASTIQYKLRKTGSAIASNYYGGWARVREDGAWVTGALTNTSYIFVTDTHPTVKASNAQMEVFAPLDTSVETTMVGRFIGFATGGLYQGITGATRASSNAPDGFQLDASSGTYSGTLQVLGYND